jgi:hypothetical protein
MSLIKEATSLLLFNYRPTSLSLPQSLIIVIIRIRLPRPATTSLIPLAPLQIPGLEQTLI